MTKQIFSLFMAGAVCILIHGFFPKTVSAHGVGYRIVESGKAVTLEFYYSGGEPLSYAQVLIFDPQDQKTEYQNGRTDKKGRFAFYPDTAGKWRIEANDGMGHKVAAQVGAVSDSGKTDQTGSRNQTKTEHQSSHAVGTIAGLSLILNLVFICYFRKAGKKTMFGNHGNLQ